MNTPAHQTVATISPPVRRALRAVLALLVATPSTAQAVLAIDSTTGPITPNEVASFKAFMQTRAVPTHSYGTGVGDHNALGDGPAGRDVEAMGMMYEATGDIEILNRMIFFVDGFIGLRNDMPNGEHLVMWTGNVDKVWVPSGPSLPGGGAGYAGGENGDTIAHIEYCARLIAESPSLWNLTVPDGDSHGYGATYPCESRPISRAPTRPTTNTHSNTSSSPARISFGIHPTGPLDSTPWRPSTSR